VGVQARLWQRHGIQKLAFAPLTSMWMWDPKTQPADDPRPAVHDSDGLLIHRNEDEWVWRDLTRPKTPRTERWATNTLQGFGLMQRDRNPDHYQDNEAHYHRRPSVWVETGAKDSWGPGWVELLELPADHEGIDNIGAYFVIDQTKVEFAESIAIRYELTFGDGLPWGHKVAPVAGSDVAQARGRIKVKFALPETLTAADRERLTAKAVSNTGEISSVSLSRTGKDSVEVSLRYTPSVREARIKVWLENQERKASEVWSYRWTLNSKDFQLVHQ
jgi:periplasmic glucans biosynthesis protein